MTSAAAEICSVVPASAGMVSFQIGYTMVADLDHRIDVDEHDELVAVLERPVVARA